MKIFQKQVAEFGKMVVILLEKFANRIPKFCFTVPNILYIHKKLSPFLAEM